MKQKLKVGDRVRVVGYGVNNGLTGVVTKVRDDCCSVAYDEDCCYQSSFGVIKGLAFTNMGNIKKI